MNYHYEIHVSVIITTQVHFEFSIRVRAQHITPTLCDLIAFSLVFLKIRKVEKSRLSRNW